MPAPKNLSIGLSTKSFKVGKDNTFTIFAEGIGIVPAGGSLPKVYLIGRNHLWAAATPTRKHDDAINVTCRCLKRKKPPVAMPAAAPGDGFDDLTVTIVYDEGGSTEDVSECAVCEVTYDG